MAIAPPLLTTERLVVRLAEMADAPAVARYYRENREHLSVWEPHRGEGFYTTGFWLAQAHRSRRDWEAGVALRVFVFRRENLGEVIGYISLTGITRGAAQFAFLGYSLAESWQGRGYMTEAVGALLRFAFREMNLHRVMANYIPWNVRSARVLRRLGFTPEGYAREYLCIDGRWQDHVLTSLSNPDWRSGIT